MPSRMFCNIAGFSTLDASSNPLAQVTTITNVLRHFRMSSGGGAGGPFLVENYDSKVELCKLIIMNHNGSVLAHVAFCLLLLLE